MRGRKGARAASLAEQLRGLTLTTLIPVLVVVVLMLVFFISYNVQYTKVSNNITQASQFNQDFKETVDLKMYYYVIGSNYSDGLPIEEVETAYELAETLLSSTENRESLKAINSVLSLCDNLKERIYEIEATEGYDARVAQLESNIYILTELIQRYMYNYLYHEAGQLATLQQALNRQLGVEIALILIVAFVMVGVLLGRAVSISRSITKPIDALCERVEFIGQGDLTAREPIAARDEKLQTLSEGFEQMVVRLNRLMDVNKQEQTRIRQMELALLQAQINPHFLYNTLDTIIWLIETRKDEQAVEMVASLSSYFRTSLSKGRDIITLREEELHVRSYLEIQQVRYRDILNYEVQMASELGQCRIPKLTLQPLVENALYHGIKNKRGLGTICIRTWAEGDMVHLSVSDTGAGMTPTRLAQVQSASQEENPVGFGMATVFRRLRLLFGDACSVQVESTLDVGTTVTLIIPQQTEVTE